MMPKRLRFTAGLTSLAFSTVLLCGCGPARPGFPPTEKHPVSDEYYGITVVDNYRWLDNLADPPVKSWTDAQNQYARSFLDKVPSRSSIAERLIQLYKDQSVSYHVGSRRAGKLFVLKHQPPKEQGFLVTVENPDDPGTERVIVDPNALDPQGATAIDFFVPSPDGRFVAVSLSRGGSEDGSVSVFETASGHRREDLVPRVNFPTASGSVAWNADASGFYYTRYPQGTERPPEDVNFYQQVYFHRLGSAATQDTFVIGKEFPRIAEIQLTMSADGKHLLVRVANGDGGEFAFYLRGPDGAWAQISTFQDGVTHAVFGGTDRLFLLSHHGAPHGKILSLPLSEPRLASAKTVVPESEAVIEGFLPTATRLFVLDLMGGPSQLRMFDLQGKFLAMLPSPPIASVSGLIALEGDQLLYGVQTYLQNYAYYRYDGATGHGERTALANSSTTDFSDCEVVRDIARSKDGTKVPMNILRRKGIVLDGKNPLLLYAYGGYNVSESPDFSVRNRLWLDQGGVYVVANLRGGGEFGEEWHNAGKLTRKQNVFDDFIACAQHLIDTKYTSPSHLAIEGGSNGGLLMGAVLTQRPDLFRAVVSHVGIYDMLRVELFPNGAFNVTEFGSVKDPEQFKALFAYSPYHHVTDGTAYPAVLMLTGDNDGRVDPANSRKMVARLQAATTSPYPVLLRTSSSSGHGIGSSLDEVTALDTDVFSFLFDQLQITYRAPGE